MKQKMISNRITHTFITGGMSCTLIVPIRIARKYGFDKPTDVIFEEMKNGVFIKKLDLDSVEKQERQEEV